MEHVTPDDEDVLQEESIVKAQAREDLVDTNVAVQIRGLGKTYPGTTQLGCFKCKRTSTYHAVKVIKRFQLSALFSANNFSSTYVWYHFCTKLHQMTDATLDMSILYNLIYASIG